MIEDKATEKLKKKAQDAGLIVNAGADNGGSKPKPKSEGKAKNKS